VADDVAFRVPQSFCNRLFNSPDELDAMTSRSRPFASDARDLDAWTLIIFLVAQNYGSPEGSRRGTIGPA